MARRTQRRSSSRPPATTIAAGFVLLWAAFAVAGPAAARDASVFLIRDVAVDASAENATEARDIALADGHSVAFRRLIARLVPMAATGTVPRLETVDIAPLVQSFEVDDEKTSRVRYLARLTFQFDRPAVRRFLHLRGVKFAVTRARPRLVLPVLRKDGINLLWDRPNPWREAWTDLPEAGGLVPLLIPAGDLQDLRDISARQAVSGDPGRLRAIAKRYGAASVAVMVATLGKVGGPSRAIRVATATYGTRVDRPAEVESYPVDSSEPVDRQFRSVASRAARRIQEAWKAGNLLSLERSGEIDVVVPVSGLDSWISVSRALSDTPSTDDVQVLSVSRDAVRARLRYFGETAAFEAALLRSDLHLRRGDGSWILTHAGDESGTKQGATGSGS